MLTRKTQLTRLTRQCADALAKLANALLPSKTQLTRLTGCRKPAPLGLLERLLRALASRLKPCLPQLARGPRLLLQDIALQFLLGDGLAAAAKSSGAHGLRPHTLLRDIALTADVRHCLVDYRLLVGVHKSADARWRELTGGAIKCLLSLLHLRRNACGCVAQKSDALLQTLNALLHLRRNACGCVAQKADALLQTLDALLHEGRYAFRGLAQKPHTLLQARNTLIRNKPLARGYRARPLV